MTSAAFPPPPSKDKPHSVNLRVTFLVESSEDKNPKITRTILNMGHLELKCSFSEELTQILIYPESLMTYMGDPESRSVSVSLLDIQREST